MAITTGDAVPGELITATWGDQVRADLTALDTGKFNVTGGTIAGNLITTGYMRTGDLPTTPLPGFQAGADGTLFSTKAVVAANISLQRQGSAYVAGQEFVRFTGGSGQAVMGTITMPNGTTVAYNTTSDPRLKEVTGDVTDAAAIAAQLGAAAFRGRWIDPETRSGEGDEWVFLSSHDVEDVAPFAVTGDRDATDDAGNIEPQQVNYPALVPLLFAALSDALERIAVLEAAP